MAELKTKVNDASVKDFLNAVPDENKRKDSFRLLEIFEEITGEKPKMWGTSIVGFGMFHYKSERSSQEGDWPLTGFSPRKAALTLYSMHHVDEKAIKTLGKYKKGGGCLYIKRLSDVDEKVLKQLITAGINDMKKRYNVK